jgi:aminoglycoside 6'-N-acetyltransferase I
MIRSVTAADSAEWLRMRHSLWPDGRLAEHKADIERFFLGDRREPAEVLLAFTGGSVAVGFAELSIRNIVDGCSSDRVAYLEGWFVVPEFRRRGIGRDSRRPVVCERIARTFAAKDRVPTRPGPPA